MRVIHSSYTCAVGRTSIPATAEPAADPLYQHRGKVQRILERPVCAPVYSRPFDVAPSPSPKARALGPRRVVSDAPWSRVLELCDCTLRIVITAVVAAFTGVAQPLQEGELLSAAPPASPLERGQL